MIRRTFLNKSIICGLSALVPLPLILVQNSTPISLEGDEIEELNKFKKELYQSLGDNSAADNLVEGLTVPYRILKRNKSSTRSLLQYVSQDGSTITMRTLKNESWIHIA